MTSHHLQPKFETPTDHSLVAIIFNPDNPLPSEPQNHHGNWKPCRHRKWTET
ncbi:hypothetical protein Hanom_Chr02g00114571 [Helianthus anomalus]